MNEVSYLSLSLCADGDISVLRNGDVSTLLRRFLSADPQPVVIDDHMAMVDDGHQVTDRLVLALHGDGTLKIGIRGDAMALQARFALPACLETAFDTDFAAVPPRHAANTRQEQKS